MGWQRQDYIERRCVPTIPGPSLHNFLLLRVAAAGGDFKSLPSTMIGPRIKLKWGGLQGFKVSLLRIDRLAPGCDGGRLEWRPRWGRFSRIELVSLFKIRLDIVLLELKKTGVIFAYSSISIVRSFDAVVNTFHVFLLSALSMLVVL